VARQSPNRPEADEPEADKPVADEPVADLAATDDDVAETATADEVDTGDRSLWDEVRITPVEIALPAGVGFTLRAYRLASGLTPTEIDLTADEDPFDARERVAAARLADEDGDDDDEVVILDEEYAALLAEDDDADADPKAKPKAKKSDGDQDDEPDAADFEDEKAEADEEIPVFLSNRGRLLLFKSAEGLVSFIRSGAKHDLAQLDTWTTFAERVQNADIVALDEDSYELDLVVENLRGGADVWDPDLVIGAGEIARDLGFALGLREVLVSLEPGSPLDALDEGIRAEGFLARRRLRKISAEQVAIGWRTMIGKLATATEWHD
jgi:hypothetical protein